MEPSRFMQEVLERNRADGGKTGEALRAIMTQQGIKDLGAMTPEQCAWVLQALDSVPGGAA
jgi:hypothetical protein